MPNLSVTVPKYAPQKVSCKGMPTWPPADSLANSSSHCSRLWPAMAMEKLFPGFSGGPGVELHVSLPIRMLAPTGSETCMTRSFSASGTPISGGACSKVFQLENSPPKTER